jgi:hypothetical protein
MDPVNRRVTYKLYPTAAWERALWQCHRLQYNAALQERNDAYRLASKSIGFAAQCKSLTEIRAEHPEEPHRGAGPKLHPQPPRGLPSLIGFVRRSPL